MDIQRLIERNKSVALDLYGDKLNKDKNIVGTNYYFDECWRLRARIDSATKEAEEANGKIFNA